MKALFLSILFSLLASSYFAISDHVNSEVAYVKILNKGNVETTIKQNKIVFLNFNTPWCDHCKETSAHFESVARVYKEDYGEEMGEFKVFFAEFNVDDSKEISTKYGIDIKSLPAIKLFIDGSQEDYSGPLHQVNIQAFLERKMGIQVKNLRSFEEAEEYRKHFDLLVLLVGGTDNAYNTFQEVARTYVDIPFAECNECQEGYEVDSDTVIIFRSFGEKKITLSSWNESELTEFVRWSIIPPVTSFNDRVSEIVFGKQTPVLIFFREDGSEDVARLDELASQVTKHAERKVQIVISDIKNGWENKLAEITGVKLDQLPAIRILNSKTEKYLKYKLEGEQTEENVKKFIDSFMSGKLEEYKKSMPLPDPLREEMMNIKTAVGLNFKEMVNKEDKHVLIAFYDPWCQKCMHLAGIFYHLFLGIKDTNPNIELQKFDYTNNDPDNLIIHTIPTVKLYKIGEKENPIDFPGEERTLANFVRFLSKHIPDFVPFPTTEPNLSTLEEQDTQANERYSQIENASVQSLNEIEAKYRKTDL